MRRRPPTARPGPDHADVRWQRCLRFALIFGGVLLLQAMVNLVTAVAVHDANVWALVLMLWWAPVVGLVSWAVLEPGFPALPRGRSLG